MTPLRVALLTLGDPNQISGGYLYHRRIADRAPAHDADVRFFSFPEWPFPLPALALSRLMSEVRDSQADVMVVDSIVIGLLALYRADVQIPILGSLHQPPGGVGHTPSRTSLQVKLDLRAYGMCSRLIVASELLAADLTRRGVCQDKLVVVPPGRDPAQATGAVHDLRQGRNLGLLCVANWLPNKGILYLLQALSMLPDEIATLHLAGDPEANRGYAGRVWRRLREEPLRGQVVVHGPVAPGQVADLYRDADVFCLPSFVEAYATVCGEAMAFGLPIIAWRTGNIPFLVGEAEGILVESGDSAGLAAAVRRLSDDPELRHRMGEAARLRSRSRPTWDETAALFFQALRSVVEVGQEERPLDWL